MAPTKPLVAQQVDACHRVCGIPGSDAAEMTGEIVKATRARLVRKILPLRHSTDRLLLVGDQKSILYDTSDSG